ncbi:hypothetical protein [Beijerinckia indica]|uniref:Uncharacterized protein n=1 Tax=Beijerinckia indica subsp. indica (strain ATCC 9039 / DSM 1715 / NCIMB 8712) TaxID=395963 RepID=B2IL87_BEII9|nr:hypothetical protein [Beijerinckia indica]ACB97287.1 hypothetical protein Bind_3736 [Beijerinckia indica subsp. indica ATCC 9039]
MADGTILPTDIVKSLGDFSIIAKMHPIGPTDQDQDRRRANAQLFIASRDMALLLEEAFTAYSAEFENDQDISGADFLEWFANWRQRVKRLTQSLP